MSSGPQLRVQVVDGENEPLSGRIVVGERRDADASVGHWMTDGGGEFAVEVDGDDGALDPDELAFTVRNPQRGGAEERVRERELIDRGDGSDVRLVVSAPSVKLHGMV